MKVTEGISRIIKGKRYEQYLFVQFLIWVSLPLLIMTAITYYIYNHSEDVKSRFMLDAYAEQMQDTCGNYFTDIKEYYLDIINGDIYQELLNRQSLPWSSLEELVDLQKQLAGGRIDNNVKSYCFINARYDWVLCNYGMYSMPRLKNAKEVQQLIKMVEEDSNDILWIDNSEVPSHYEKGVIGYGFADFSGELMILKSENFLGELEGILIVQMQLDDIENSISMYSNLGYDTMIVCGEEVIVGRESDYARKIQEAEGSIAENIMKKDARYDVKFIHDEANGLDYVIAYDMHVNRDKAMVLVWSAVLFILAYVFLLTVLKKVTNKVSEPFWKLKEHNEEQQEKIKEFFVINLLKGIWEKGRINQYLEKYEWKTCEGYRLMMLKLENKSIELERILNGMTKEMKESCFILPVKYRNYLAVIVGADDEMQVEYKTAVLFRDFAKYTRETFRNNIIAGISGYFTSLETCSLAVSQCMEAMMARAGKVQEESVLAVYDDLALKSRNKESVSQGMESELYEAISEKNREKSLALLHQILQNTKVSELWGIDRTVYVHQLVMGILMILQKEDIPLSDIFPETKMDILDMKDYIFDNDKLEQYICHEILTPVIEVLEQNQGSKDMEIVKKAARLIRENRGDITLTECAEYLGCHPSHLSRVIKKEKGVGFQDMINEEKIERAKHLLEATTISVAEIAELVGYNNTQNFIRFFKNQIGITPAKYRKERGNE